MLCEPGNLTDAIFQLVRLSIIIWMYGTWIFGRSYKIIKKKNPPPALGFITVWKKEKKRRGHNTRAWEKKYIYIYRT